MSNLAIFNFQSQKVRITMDEKNNPQFVASDVAKALGYSNVNDAISRHCKGVVKHDTLQTAGGTQNLRVIYEPDVYRLIFGSKLESAIAFQDWVFEEVLPSIRKKGRYYFNRLTETQEDKLRQAISDRSKITGEHRMTIYTQLNKYFSNEFGIAMSGISSLRPDQYQHALDFINDYHSSEHAKLALIDKETTHMVMEYIHDLNQRIKDLGGKTMPMPELDRQTIANAVVTRIFDTSRMMISLNIHGNPHITFIPSDHWIVTESNVINLVKAPDGISKKLLPALIKASAEKLGAK